MATKDEVLKVVRKNPGRTQLQISKAIFGNNTTQQRINAVCAKLCLDGLIRHDDRRPYRYHVVKSLTISPPTFPTSCDANIPALPKHSEISPINVNVQIVNLRPIPVHIIQKDSALYKGGVKKNSALLKACAKVSEKHLCYYWRSQNKILYIGSAKPYINHRTTLYGRVSQYLQNHREVNGKKNQNKRIFEALKNQLKKSDVELGRFVFDFITARDFTLSYNEFSSNNNLTVMIEQVLIGYHRLQSEATWNL